MKSPIFIFSLPRSGSTFLQRVLESHHNIASCAEPWIMLPLCYLREREGVLSEYGHNISSVAINDFINTFPNKYDDFYKALGNFSNELYEKQCKKREIYFLDKTPRYYNVIKQISKAHPNAKFIFLFRNPVSVMSSMFETWADGRLKNMYSFHRDLNHGIFALSDGYKLLKTKSLAIKYEDLITNPTKYIKNICKYLELDFDEKMLKNISSNNIKGRMGDPTGVEEYSEIDRRPLEKWKYVFNTRFRKKIIKKYVESLSDEVLNIQGYEKQSILAEIDNMKHLKKNNMQDRLDLLKSRVIQFCKPNIWLGKKCKKVE